MTGKGLLRLIIDSKVWLSLANVLIIVEATNDGGDFLVGLAFFGGLLSLVVLVSLAPLVLLAPLALLALLVWLGNLVELVELVVLVMPVKLEILKLLVFRY